MACLDKDHSNFTENYIDRQNNTHVLLLEYFLLFKRGSQCTSERSVLPIPYKCHQYLLKLIITGIITISTFTCLQNVTHSQKEECTKQKLIIALFSDYRFVCLFHKT
jgi:hypothetical protein